MGSSNFLQFNPTQANQLTDAQYVVDATRTGGAGVDAIWPSPSANKTLYQSSTFVDALAQSLANKGFVLSDANLATLTSVLANLLTTADVPGGLQVVPYASAITLNTAAYSGFQITLTGNTTLTTTGVVAGQVMALLLIQDVTGGRTVTYVGGEINGGLQPDPTPFTASLQLFKANFGLAFVPAGPLMTLTGINNTPIGATSPAGGTFTTLSLAAGAPSGQVLTGNGTSFVAGPGLGNMTASFVARAFGTQYQNTDSTPRTICVTGNQTWGVGNNGSVTAYIGSASASNLCAANSISNGPGYASVTFDVPPGWYYEVHTNVGTDTGALNLSSWTEWAY